MTRTRRPALLLGALAASALLLAGCTVNGGGSINSATGAKKATFGFTWHGEDCQPFVSCSPSLAKGFWADGTVQFRIADGGLETLAETGDGCWHGSGQYVAQGRTRGTGDIEEIVLCDRGEPGVSSGDSVSIDLDGGPYGWYQNSGPLLGGNLKQTKDAEI